MSWVRLDDDFCANKKTGQLTDSEFRCWMRVLCYCAKQEDPTVDEITRREVAGLSRVRLLKYADLDLLDEVGGAYEVHDWSKYQPKDRTGAERQAAWRARRKLSTTVTSSVTPAVIPPNTRAFPVPEPQEKEIVIPTLASFEGEDYRSPEQRLIAACGGGQAATDKIRRTIISNKLAEGDVVNVLEQVQLPDTQDPLGRALKALKKRGDEKKRAA